MCSYFHRAGRGVRDMAGPGVVISEETRAENRQEDDTGRCGRCEMLEDILNKSPSDYYLYVGQISSQGYHDLSDLLDEVESMCESNKKKEKACLVLMTTGGDPHAGFRMARALNHHYPKNVRLFVPDICKSAGTLVALGANELAISNRGELGPLDVQVAKQEEIFSRSSGLDIMASLGSLNEYMRQTFHDSFMYYGSFLGARLGAQLAQTMASGIIAPIASQIDPMKLGEHVRALRIATDYGKILGDQSENIDINGIEKLVRGYPTHGFVIDRKEAMDIFHKVSGPDDYESEVEKCIKTHFSWLLGRVDDDPAIVGCLSSKNSVFNAEQTDTRQDTAVQQSATPKNLESPNNPDNGGKS